MSLKFDIERVELTEFGVGRDDGEERTFIAIPVDADVQTALREMVTATWDEMQQRTEGPTKYDPAEKHEATEYLYLPLNDDLAMPLRELHDAANLPLESHALDDAAALFCYFSRMTDGKGRRLTALRRATQFKGVLKTRLLRFVTDSLTLIPDRVFKLDGDFDLLIDSTTVYILRPSGFEFAGQLQEAVSAAVPQNIEVIQHDLGFVDFARIGEYATTHPRAARYLASIRGQKETKHIDRNALRKLCNATGVEVHVANGKISVTEGHELGFLEVLDRRRYELQLVKGMPERFRASSRQRIQA